MDDVIDSLAEIFIELLKGAIVFAAGLVLDAYGGWLLMLGLGAAHSMHGAGVVPALGFWACFWLAFGITALVNVAYVGQRFSKWIDE